MGRYRGTLGVEAGVGNPRLGLGASLGLGLLWSSACTAHAEGTLIEPGPTDLFGKQCPSILARSPVSAVAVAEDGATVVVGTGSGAEFWSFKEPFGWHRRAWDAYQGPVDRIAFSKGPESLIVGSRDRLQYIDLKASKTSRGSLPGVVAQVAPWTVNRSFGWVASVDAKGLMTIWKYEENRLLSRFWIAGRHGFRERPVVLGTSRAPNEVLVATSRGLVQRWRFESRGAELVEETAIGRDLQLEEAMFSSDGALLAYVDSTKGCRIRSPFGSELAVLGDRTGQGRRVVLSPTGGFLVEIQPQVLDVWDVVSGSLVQRYRGVGPLETPVFAPDERALAIPDGNAVRVLPVQRVAEWSEEPCSSAAIRALVWSPSRDRLAIASSDGRIRLYPVDAGRPSGVPTWYQNHRQVRAMAFHPRLPVLALGTGSDLVSLVSIPELRQLEHLGTEADPAGHAAVQAAFSRDGRLLALVGATHRLAVWDLESRQPVALPGEIALDVLSCGWPPGDSGLVCIDRAGRLRRWLPGSHSTEVGPELLGSNRIHAWAWSQDLRVVAIAYEQGIEENASKTSLGAFTTEDLRPLALSLDRQMPLYHLAINPNYRIAIDPRNERLAVGSQDGRILLLNLNRSAQREAWAHHSAITALEFSPDGNRLLSGGEDARVLDWDLLALPIDLSAEDLPGARPPASWIRPDR